jgi:hypothetical protein
MARFATAAVTTNVAQTTFCLDDLGEEQGTVITKAIASFMPIRRARPLKDLAHLPSETVEGGELRLQAPFSLPLSVGVEELVHGADEVLG